MDVKEANRQLKILLNTAHIREHLMKVGLMNKHGEIVSREEYERRSKRRARPSTACHRKISQSKSPNIRRHKSPSPKQRFSTPNQSAQLTNRKCLITMIYYGLPSSIESYSRSDIDDIIVMQQHCGGENLLVFKGKLKPNTTFQFESRRQSNYPFALAFYVNGLIDSRLSICCESRYRHNVRIGGKGGLFGIVNVENSKACRRCRIERRMKRLEELKAKRNTSIAYVTTSPEPNFSRSSSSDSDRDESIVLNEENKRNDSLNVNVTDDNLHSSRSTHNENLLSPIEPTPIRRRVTSAFGNRRRPTINNK